MESNPSVIHPLFSVLVANFNNGQFIEEAISSVQAQTYQNWELIIVDDASSDNSVSVIKELQSRDKRIILITNTVNSGCGSTKHQCIVEANGDICGFLDPDDVLHYQALEKMVLAHAERPDISMVYSKLYYCDNSLEVISESNWVKPIRKGSSNLVENTISHFCSFKRSCYCKTIGIELGLKSAVDKDLYFKLEEVAPAKFISETLYYYRQNKNGVSQSVNRRSAFENFLHVIESAYNRRKRHDTLRLSYMNYLGIKSNVFLNQAAYSWNVEGSSFDSIVAIFKSCIHWPFSQNLRRIKLLVRILMGVFQNGINS